MHNEINKLKCDLSNLQIAHEKCKNSSMQIDWHILKEVICGMEAVLRSVCDVLPPSLAKMIICPLSTLLGVACKDIPDKDKPNCP